MGKKDKWKYKLPTRPEVSEEKCFELAIKYKNDPEYQYMEQLAQIMISYNDATGAYQWATEIGTHLDDMAEVIINSNNASRASYWVGSFDTHYEEMWQVIKNNLPKMHPTVYVESYLTSTRSKLDECFDLALTYGSISSLTLWIKEIQYLSFVKETGKDYSTPIKLKLIREDKVDKFIAKYNDNYRTTYTRSDFYSDLPDDWKLGVMV